MSRTTLTKPLSVKNGAKWMEGMEEKKAGAVAGTSASSRSKSGAGSSEGATTSTEEKMKEKGKCRLYNLRGCW
eukprot:4346082-Pleurochrysis_carterae.AAC.2